MAAHDRGLDPDRTRTNVGTSAGLEAGARVGGRYRVEALLGVGGMGMVYRATDEELGIEVALKVLRPELAGSTRFLDRFRREVVLARQVSHPNVVRIHDLGNDGDLVFMTMDLVQGTPLDEVIEEGGALEPGRALVLVREIAEALAVAHGKGVVHRDLKPSNILVDRDGRAHLTDFGVARSVSSAGLTRAGAIVGTPDYLSPEQARGEEVGPPSDLYSLGVVLFEAVTGHMPFPGGSQAEVIAQRLHRRPLSLAEVGYENASPRLREVIDGLLEPKVSRRIGSAEELVEILDGTRRSGRKRRLAFGSRAVGIVAAALVLVAGLWYAWPGTESIMPTSGSEAVVAAAAPRFSIAVLPLVDQTGREDLAWLSEGLAEHLAEKLAEQPGLRVVDPWRTIRTIEDLGLSASASPDRLRTLAGLLDVDRLLVGRVRSPGSSLTVELRLLDRDGSAVPRAESIEGVGEADRLFALAEGLAGRVADALDSPLAPRAAPIEVSDRALQELAVGSSLLGRGEVVAAVPRFEAATDAAPDLAIAWLRLAEAYDLQGRFDDAEDAAVRASELAGGGEDRVALEIAARRAALEGDLEKSHRLLARLVERFPHDVDLRLALGEAFVEAGQLAEAIAVLTRVVESSPSLARAWFQLAKASILAGDSRGALEEPLVRALVLMNRLGNDQGKGDVFNAMGLAQERLGRLDEAMASYRQAADLRRAVGDLRGFAISLRNVAALAASRGDYAAATAALAEARTVLESLGDRHGLAELLDAEGVLAEEQGRNGEALDLYRRSLALRTELGDQMALADSYNNVGYAYYVLGQYDNAGVYWRQAMDARVAAGDQRGLAIARQSLASLDLAQGRWDKALAGFHAALEEARRLDMRSAVAVSLGNLGRLAALQGRFSDALAAWQEALSVLEALEDSRGWNEYQLQRAEVLARLGALDEAASGTTAVEKRLGTAGNAEQAGRAALVRSRLAWRQQSDRQAGAELARARQFATESGATELELWVRLEEAQQSTTVWAAQRDELGRAVTELGNAELELRWGLVDAQQALAADRLETAREALDRVRREARGVGHWFGTLEWHVLAATAWSDRASSELERAATELDRVRVGLSADLLAGLLATLPEELQNRVGAADGTGPPRPSAAAAAATEEEG